MLTFFILQIILACIVGHGFGYAIHQLSPLGRLKFKPFSCPECLTWWGGAVCYFLMTSQLWEAVAVGFIAIVISRWIGVIEYRIATGGSGKMIMPPERTGGCKGGTRLPKPPVQKRSEDNG